MNSRFKARRASPPLDQRALHELALRYVGKYATTRARLCAYLSRKLRERGWEGEREPDLEGLAARFAEVGYVDDAAYALSKSRALSERGYGKKRLAEKLRLSGIGEDDSREALDISQTEAIAAALRFAQRRKIGPFAAETPDRMERERAISAMVRAGHSFGLARAIASLAPGSEVDVINIGESSRFDVA